MTNSNSFIAHLHAFRGFAILNVVGAHCWSFMIFWTGDLSSEAIKWLFWFTETIFHGSTIYFAIISGLLFSKILKSRGQSAFYKSKFYNVLLPYVLVTLVLTAYYWPYFLQNPEINNTLTDFIRVASNNIFTGSGAIHFWYIPVLTVMFLITFLLSWLQQNSNKATWLLMLFPLVISRSPFPDFLKPQSFVFFIGAYVVGIAMGRHYDRVKQWLSNNLKAVFLVAITTSVTIYLTYSNGYEPEGFYSVRQSLIYLQKIAISLLVLHWFSAKEQHLPQWLSTLGNYAFAIFFLHVVFIDLIIQSVRGVLASSRTVELIALFGSFNFIAGILGSILVAAIVKQLLGKYSRKIVGV